MSKSCIYYNSDNHGCSLRMTKKNECSYHYTKLRYGKGKSQNITINQVVKILTYYGAGLSANQTAKEIGVSKATVLRVAKNAGINRTDELGMGMRYTEKRRTPSPKTFLNRSEYNSRILATIEYGNFRKRMFKRDMWTCQECGYKGSKIQLDHIKPRCLFPELTFSEDNVRTLCIECHKNTPTYGVKALKYKEVIA